MKDKEYKDLCDACDHVLLEDNPAAHQLTVINNKNESRKYLEKFIETNKI